LAVFAAGRDGRPDGATSAGDAHEAPDLAAIAKAPCVFYVQNNHLSDGTALARTPNGLTELLPPRTAAPRSLRFAPPACSKQR